MKGKTKTAKISPLTHVVADDNAPHILQIQEFESHDLAAIDHKEGFKFRQSDTHLQLDARLRQWLPKFFNRVDSLPRRVNHSFVEGQDEYLRYYPQYILLGRAGRKVSIVANASFPGWGKSHDECPRRFQERLQGQDYLSLYRRGVSCRGRSSLSQQRQSR
ncbi:hypothetical protein C8J56DRAFT_908941 [Mycena floridula]|nr:hypothetical protein C8J56DRAFT_908941 [Mycena floridula]